MLKHKPDLYDKPGDVFVGKIWKTQGDMKEDILSFTHTGAKDMGAPHPTAPEFWGYYADYDWVVFCWLFGAMIDLPEGWPKYCRDLKQISDHYNVPHLEEPKGEHNALENAKWNQSLYEHIRQYTTQDVL